MATQERETKRGLEFVRMLAEGDFSADFLVIDWDIARSVLTERRMELLETVRDEEVESVTHLAEMLDRDKAAVSRDLDLLFGQDMIVYEREGTRKIPTLKHETVVVEPLL